MLFIKYKLLMWINYWKKMSFGRTLVFFLFAILGGCMIYGLCWGLYRLLSYTADVPFIGQILVLKFISLVFMWMFFMIILSSLVASFSTIYFTSDLILLMVSPIFRVRIFLWKAWETSLYVSWMIMLVVIPFLIAFARVKHESFMFYITGIILLVPFSMIASNCGVMISTVLMSMCPHKRLRDAILIFAVIAGSAVYIIFRMVKPEELIRPDVFERVLQYVALIQTPTLFYLPSWWITGAIQSYTTHAWNDVWSYTAMLVFGAVVSTAGMALLGEWLFYKGWTGAQESASHRKKQTITYTKVVSPWMAILKKDSIIFFRDVNQWTQLLLLSALVIVYLFSIYKLPLDTWYLKSLISFLNIGMIGFVLSAIALRFVFPAISLEGKSYWIIAAAPLSTLRFIWIKFISTFPVIVVIGFVLIIVSNYMLKADLFVHILGIASIALIAVTLSGMGIGMGSAFPYCTIENIARIETSMGGILYMIFSLFYVGLVISLTAIPMRMYFYSHMMHGDSPQYALLGVVLTILGVISALCFGVSMAVGKKRLEAYEF